MKHGLWIFIILCLISSSVSQDEPFKCSNDQDCSDRGTCDSGQCYCKWFWQGEKCDLRWKDMNNGWESYWIFYCVYTCFLNLIALVFLSYYFYIAFKNYLLSRQLNAIIISLGLLIIASLARIYYYGYDGHDYRGTLTFAEDFLYYYVPIFIWFFVDLLLILYWINLTQQTNLKVFQQFKKVYQVTTGTMIALIVVLVPIALWASFNPTPLNIMLLNIAIAIFMISGVSLASIAGFRLHKILADMPSFSTKAFLVTKTRLMIGMTFPFILLITVLIIAFAIDATRKPWAYVTVHIIYRTIEVSVVTLMLLVMKGKVTTVSTSDDTSAQTNLSLNEVSAIRHFGSVK